MDKLGIFKKFWEGAPNHLPLLNLNSKEVIGKSWNLKKSLNLLNEIYESNDTEIYIVNLKTILENENWRPQLLACFGILKLESEKRKEFCKILWKIFAKGSWIKPQILVTLSIIDNSFVKRSLEIINSKEFEREMSNKDDHVEMIFEKLLYNNDPFENKVNLAKEWKTKLIKIIEKI